MFSYFRQLFNRITNQVQQANKNVSKEVVRRFAWMKSNNIVNEDVVTTTSTSSSAAGGKPETELFMTVKFTVEGLGISNAYVQPQEFDRVNNHLYLSSLNVSGTGAAVIIAKYHSQDFSFLDFITSTYVNPVSFQQPYFLENNNKFYFMGNTGIVELSITPDLQDFTETVISPFVVTGNGGTFFIHKIYGHYIYCNYSLDGSQGEWLIINKNTGIVEQRTDALTPGLATRGFNGYFDVGSKKLYFIQRRVSNNSLTFRTFDFNTMEETVYNGMPSGIGFGYVFGKIRKAVSETVWEIYGIVGTSFVLDTVDVVNGVVLNRVEADEHNFPSLSALPAIWTTEKGGVANIWTLVNGQQGRKLDLNIRRFKA